MSNPEHTFKCGIVGRSYDATGDAFLGAMMQSEAMDNEPMRRLERSLADAEAVRRDRDAAARIIAILVQRLGGRCEINDAEFVMQNPDDKLITFRDEYQRGIVLKVQPAQSAPATPTPAPAAERKGAE